MVGNMKSAVFKEQNYQLKHKINMKTKPSILARFKAFFILLVSGWRSVEVYGHPKQIMGNYLATLKNGTVHALFYTNAGQRNYWESLITRTGISEDNQVIYWKPFGKAPIACR